MKRRKEEARAEDLALDPGGFERRLSQYLEWLRFSHFSEGTAKDRQLRVRYFMAWCLERSLLRPTEITKPILERFQASLFHARRRRDGLPLSVASQRNFLTSVKGFFRWLSRSNHVLFNPAADLILPRLSRRLPKHVLNEAEAERVINLPNVETPLGLRDRAILETLYSTGVRRMELITLRLYDIDRERGTLMVREGKGRGQRVVPIGDRALGWVEKYLAEVRSTLVVEPDEGYIFLTYAGAGFDPNSLTILAGTYVRRAELGKVGAVHLFRHTAATVMLEHGADIRFIQAMLGHAKLETTQLYTQVSIRKLKEVHTATHPARLRRIDPPPAEPVDVPPAELVGPPPAEPAEEPPPASTSAPDQP